MLVPYQLVVLIRSYRSTSTSSTYNSCDTGPIIKREYLLFTAELVSTHCSRLHFKITGWIGGTYGTRHNWCTPCGLLRYVGLSKGSLQMETDTTPLRSSGYPSMSDGDFGQDGCSQTFDVIHTAVSLRFPVLGNDIPTTRKVPFGTRQYLPPILGFIGSIIAVL